MSDAIWDIEYARADTLKEEIINYCNEHQIECPQFKKYIRSCELKKIFEELKSNNKSEVLHISNIKGVYYLVYTTSMCYNTECPVYLEITDTGHLLQGSIYDASKYVSKSNAERKLQTLSKMFKDKDFDVISIDKRIFGLYPRNIVCV